MTKRTLASLTLGTLLAAAVMTGCASKNTDHAGKCGSEKCGSKTEKAEKCGSDKKASKCGAEKCGSDKKASKCGSK